MLSAAGLLDELPLSAHLFFFQSPAAARGSRRARSQRGVDDLMVLGERTRIVPFDNPLDYPWRRFAAAGCNSSAATTRRARSPTRTSSWPAAGAPRQALGAALRARGVRGGAEGEAMLREAVEVLAAANARLEQARALVELGAASAATASARGARPAAEGVELAHRAGAPSLVERGNEELAATGARPRKLVVSGVDSLTASERRVAELAAQDRSNKEIAQALFVTVKTVEVHLSSVYRKLQITSRRQLAPALAAAAAA